MSDLFTTLAREALGVPMAVAPRRRSRFEAPSPSLNLAAESEDVTAAMSDAAPPHAEIRAEKRQNNAAPSRIEDASTPSRERVREADADGEIASPTEFDQQSARSRGKTAWIPSETARSALEPARIASEQTDTAPDAAPRAPPSFAAIPVAGARPARSSAAAAQANEMGDDEASQTAASDAPAPQRRRSLPDVEPAAPRAVVPEILRPETAARAHAEPQGAQAAPQPRAARPQTPPAIHVTIGRVEVRAVTPPAARPAPQPQPVKPAMSLADYLEQRNRSG